MNEGTSIPAFQTFFNYVLLNLIYTSYTLYRYGFKKWCHLIYKDGWKCEDLCHLSYPSAALMLFSSVDFILSFLDVEGNYFFVLAYRYVSRLVPGCDRTK